MNATLKKQLTEFTSSLTTLRWQTLVNNFVDRLLTILLATGIFLVILWIGRLIINYLFRQTRRIEILGGNRRAATFHALTLNVFRYTCYLFYLYAVLSLIGVPVGTLVAGAGIFSIALGLGAQGFVSDVVNGLFPLMEQQLDVGDVVEIGQVKGKITTLGLRTTKILSADGTLTFIPNRNITTVKNFSRHQLTQSVDLPLSPQAPLAEVNELVAKEINRLASQPSWKQTLAEIKGPVTQTSGQLFFKINVTADAATVSTRASELLDACLTSLNQAQIPFATPHGKDLRITRIRWSMSAGAIGALSSSWLPSWITAPFCEM